jgi:drug/metabolite transporter (DMT)-like permease
MPDTATRRATLGLLLTAAGGILFASKGLFSKALFHGGVDFVTLTALRAVLALPLFAALGIWRGFGGGRRASRRAYLLAALAGVLCYGIGALVDFHALELIDVSLERALLFTYPALIVGWQSLRTRRFPRPAILAAMALTYGGILLVVGVLDGDVWRANLTGALFVLGCAATTATYFLLGERCIPELGSSGFTIVAMAAAAVVVCTVFLFTRSVSTVATLTAQQWLLLLALAVLCMFLPTLFQAEGIRRIGAARGALASTVGPPAALLLGMLLLGERPTGWQVAGTALILAGMVVIARLGAPAKPAGR